MNPIVGLQILELAVSLAKTQAGGKIQQEVNLADMLLQIIGKAVQAYQDHTGEPLDPALIKVEQRA
jgi:hypothetical protein